MLVLLDFPDWLDAFDEEVYSGAVRHGIWSLHVLIHGPELIDSAEVCKRLYVLGIPARSIVHSKKSVGVMKDTIKASVIYVR